MEQVMDTRLNKRQADMVLIDLTRPNMIPSRLDNIVENLIWASDGSEVKTVIANGKVVKLDYRFTLLDFETIVKEVQLLSEMLTDYMVAAKKITGTGAHKIEDRDQKTMVRGQKSDDRDQKTVVRGQKSEISPAAGKKTAGQIEIETLKFHTRGQRSETG